MALRGHLLLEGGALGGPASRGRGVDELLQDPPQRLRQISLSRSLSPPLSPSLSILYIYIYIERERDIDIHICIHVIMCFYMFHLSLSLYIYIYMYICVYIYIYIYISIDLSIDRSIYLARLRRVRGPAHPELLAALLCASLAAPVRSISDARNATPA